MLGCPLEGDIDGRDNACLAELRGGVGTAAPSVLPFPPGYSVCCEEALAAVMMCIGGLDKIWSPGKITGVLCANNVDNLTIV